jgi:hypothetical protein
MPHNIFEEVINKEVSARVSVLLELDATKAYIVDLKWVDYIACQQLNEGNTQSVIAFCQLLARIAVIAADHYGLPQEGIMRESVKLIKEKPSAPAPEQIVAEASLNVEMRHCLQMTAL